MARNSQQSHALRRARDLLGDVKTLARRLGISQARLALYLDDLEPIPEAVFTRAIDILVDIEVVKLSEEARSERARRNGSGAGEKNGNAKNDGNGRRRKP